MTDRELTRIAAKEKRERRDAMYDHACKLVRELHAQGMGDSEISLSTGYSRGRIHDIRVKLGLSTQEPCRLAMGAP